MNDRAIGMDVADVPEGRQLATASHRWTLRIRQRGGTPAMIGPDPDIERAYDALEEYGCPICGESASHLTVQFIDAIGITPCHHTVTIEDAMHMEQFYETLRRTEVRRDL